MNYREITSNEYQKLLQNKKIFIIILFKIQIN